ncbi:hypothetical protein ACFRI7_12885 [Streptomyces sp. NPDC056716]|uniref:hypothetical protein n=1 Tax=unclassified Streptomyces TaxID=2593676 RepID=UPI00369D818C
MATSLSVDVSRPTLPAPAAPRQPGHSARGTARYAPPRHTCTPSATEAVPDEP